MYTHQYMPIHARSDTRFLMNEVKNITQNQVKIVEVYTNPINQLQSQSLPIT